MSGYTKYRNVVRFGLRRHSLAGSLLFVSKVDKPGRDAKQMNQCVQQFKDDFLKFM